MVSSAFETKIKLNQYSGSGFRFGFQSPYSHLLRSRAVLSGLSVYLLPVLLFGWLGNIASSFGHTWRTRKLSTDSHTTYNCTSIILLLYHQQQSKQTPVSHIPSAVVLPVPLSGYLWRLLKGESCPWQ